MTSVFSWHPLAFSGYSLRKGVEHGSEVPVTGTFSFPFANFYSEGKCLLVIFFIFRIFGKEVEHSSGVPVTSSSSLSIANSQRDIKYFLVVLFYLLPLTDFIKKYNSKSSMSHCFFSAMASRFHDCDGAFKKLVYSTNRPCARYSSPSCMVSQFQHGRACQEVRLRILPRLCHYRWRRMHWIYSTHSTPPIFLQRYWEKY